MDLPLGASDPLVPVKQRGESGVLVPAGVPGEGGVGLQHRFEPLTGVSGLVPDLGQVREVGCDLPIVPGEEDRFDVREVLVERRPELSRASYRSA
jgi:hypothetical protein